jgi:replication initiation protein RepC
MAFTKLSITSIPAIPALGSQTPNEIDIWAIFRALRDSRSMFALRPGHIQTLQAMLSFLRPGHGDTVFASNNEICRRVGGIDERTLRRHINRLVELGFMKRHDSPNRKRYRVRSSDGHAISYGLSLTPLLERASELLSLAQEIENNRRDRIFLRKQILTKLARIEEHEPSNGLLSEVRKTLRRKLKIVEYRNLLTIVDAEYNDMSTAVDAPETIKLPANDGQIVRHHSKSIKEQKDLERKQANDQPTVQKLISICDEAVSFSTKKLHSWLDIESHARSLAPMMGIHSNTFNKAKTAIGSEKASCAIFIILQLGNQIKNFEAYFQSITLGKRVQQFNPSIVLDRLSKTDIQNA